MLQNVKFHEATKQSNEGLAAFCYPGAIRKLFDKKRDTDGRIYMTFRRNAHQTSPMDLEWAANWPTAHRNLNRMSLESDHNGRQDVTAFLLQIMRVQWDGAGLSSHRVVLYSHYEYRSCLARIPHTIYRRCEGPHAAILPVLG